MKCNECENEVDLKAGDEIITDVGPMKLGEEEPRLCRACYSKGWSEATPQDFANHPAFKLRGNVPGEIVEFGTASYKPTNPEENLTDLLHLYCTAGFVGNLSEQELKDWASKAIEEQYFQAILNSKS